MIQAFLRGVHYFLAGFLLLFKPGVKRFVFVPLLINIILFISLFALLNHFMLIFNHWVMHFLPEWLAWLAIVLWFLFLISFLLFFVYTFVVFANLVAAPFNSFLAEKIEMHLSGEMSEVRTLTQNIKDFPRIIGRQLNILGYYLPRAIALLICFFIPVVQGVAAILWLIFHAWFLAMTYLDYPTDNHRIPIDRVQEWMRERRFVSLGFGVAVLVVSVIPVLNFLSIPAAVAGATKFYVDEKSVNIRPS